MRIEIKNKIWVHDPPKILRERWIRQLRIKNPAYEEAVMAGRSTWGIEEYIYNFATTPDDGLLVPRGMRRTILEDAEVEGVEVEIVDKRSIFPYREVDVDTIQYRSYQFDSVMELVKVPEGVLVSPAGSGKTVVGMSLIPVTGQPTLWLTHTGPLASQAADRAVQFLPNIGKIGLIGKGKWFKGDMLTVAMVQTLVKNPKRTDAMKDDFGLVVMDECLPAGTKISMFGGGKKDISDIADGEVTTFGTVSRKFSRRVRKLVVLHGVWDVLKGTETHVLPFVRLSETESGTVRRGRMADISVGDSLLIKKECFDSLRGIARAVEFEGETYLCSVVTGKSVEFGDFEVHDFTTDRHFFLANGVLSSNCHHVPASTFTNVVTRFNPFFLYGLTATPYRRDRLEVLMFQALGTTRTLVKVDDVGEQMVVPTVKIRIVDHSYVPYPDDLQRILEINVVGNKARNAMIAEDVLREAEAGKSCLVVSDRKEHCEILFDLLRRKWPKTGIATGDYKKSHLDETIAAANSSETTVLVVTYNLFGEGADIPVLERAFVAFPFRSKAKAVQLIGRIQRKAPGKEDAIVYDYVDVGIGILEDQFEARDQTKDCRLRAYKSVGARIVRT